MQVERLRRIKAIVHGMVQGVGFRAFARRLGLACKVNGWVMNRPDETVEICAEGDPAAIASFLEGIAHGPPFGHVDEVEIIEDISPETPSFNSFEIRRY